jgi:hypothetical protein
MVTKSVREPILAAAAAASQPAWPAPTTITSYSLNMRGKDKGFQNNLKRVDVPRET